MPESNRPLIERIARVLAGAALSSNAEGSDPSAGEKVDKVWREHVNQALAVLHTAREPDEAMAAAGDTDVCVSKDPVTAIFEKYFYDEVSPRVHPAEHRDAWYQREIERGHVDGVLFYVPLEDDVQGWDYPEQLAYLASRSIPSVLVRENVRENGSPLADFVGSLHRE